jgi:3-hydroxybutyryl-CoA dehydrogenase
VITRVAVIGIGRIGRSIALMAAMAGYEVLLVSRRGFEGYCDFKSYLDLEAAKRRINGDTSKLNELIHWTSNLEEVSAVDLVIESIVENYAEKKKIFWSLDRICKDKEILASNTSSLSVTELSKSLTRPDRFIGMHFFNPAHIMKLVEIIPQRNTSKETIDSCCKFSEALGKITIIAPDTPGFIVNRILFPMINEAICFKEQGLIASEEIDICLKFGANLPMGPLALADFIGLDTCLTILRRLYAETQNPAYKPPKLLENMVRNNELGRKTGIGFFKYKITC